MVVIRLPCVKIAKLFSRFPGLTQICHSENYVDILTIVCVTVRYTNMQRGTVAATKGLENERARTMTMLLKKIRAKAAELDLSGWDYDVFCFLANTTGECGFISLQRYFGSDNTIQIAESLARLMKRELVFQMVSSTRYYTIAIR